MIKDFFHFINFKDFWFFYVVGFVFAFHYVMDFFFCDPFKRDGDKSGLIVFIIVATILFLFLLANLAQA